MPRATPDNTTHTLDAAPSRRRLFAGLSATLLAGAALATAAHGGPVVADDADGPDAELIAACNAFDTLERQFCSHYRGGDNYIADDDERDEVVAPILAQQEALLERICATRAVTIEGIRAKARSLVLWEPDLLVAEEPFWDVQITASILQDLAGRASA